MAELKQFHYKGKTIEELKKMDINEFANLVDSRIRRSLKRGFTDAQKKLMIKIEKTFKSERKKPIKTHCRDMIILPDFVGMRIHVYDGKSFVDLTIQEEMIGHLLGEFAPTRKRLKHGTAGVGATKSSAAVSKK